MSVDTQQAIRTIKKFYFLHKRLPTYEEIAGLFHYASKNASLKLVNRLVKAGVLDKDEKGRISPKNLFSIPHLGIIHAGIPTEAYVTDDSLDLYNFIFNIPADVFSLTVKGDSMSGEAITDGDIVIVDKNKEPRNGDIVSACVDGEWTVKYYQKDSSGRISLVPANKAYPIIHPRESLEIGGVVVHVIRSYH